MLANGSHTTDTGTGTGTGTRLNRRRHNLGTARHRLTTGLTSSVHAGGHMDLLGGQTGRSESTRQRRLLPGSALHCVSDHEFLDRAPSPPTCIGRRGNGLEPGPVPT